MEALLLLAGLAIAWLAGLLALVWVVPGLIVVLVASTAGDEVTSRSTGERDLPGAPLYRVEAA